MKLKPVDKVAYFAPFEKTTGRKVVGVAYDGEQAAIKASVSLAGSLSKLARKRR